MSGVNKAIIVGNLGQDPEIRYTQQGNPVASFSIATSEKWKDKNTGQQNEDTQWHNVTAFGKLAEIVQQFVQKGSKVYIEGKLKTESWEKDGVKHYKTIIVANELQMLDSRQGAEPSANNGQHQPQSQGQAPQQQNRSQQQPRQPQQAQQQPQQSWKQPQQRPQAPQQPARQDAYNANQPQSAHGFDDFDPSIPF